MQVRLLNKLLYLFLQVKRRCMVSDHNPQPLIIKQCSHLIILLGLGLTGVPVFNVNNNCSSGSTALMMARILIQAGHGCTLAVGESIAVSL